MVRHRSLEPTFGGSNPPSPASFSAGLHGFVCATKDIDLLVDVSAENIRRLKRGMAALPDNAIAMVRDDDVERYAAADVQFLRLRIEEGENDSGC